MKRRFLLVPFVLLILGCGLITQTVAPTETLQALPTIAPSNTPSFTATAETTDTPVPSETPQAATISPLLTSIPGIATTLTAFFSTPGAENTLVAQQTLIAATQGAQLQGFSGSLLSQCPNPSASPMQSWLDIPVMPQATAGQTVQTLIGSYYCFRVPVTAANVESFYKEKLSAPNWVMQADANGSMEFVGLSQAGMQLLFVVYGPGDTNDTLVAINVTSSMSIPTTKP